MRSSCPEVGRSQRPDLDAKQRGAAAAVKQRKPPPEQRKRLAHRATSPALLDQTTTAALPRARVHLTHGTCRSAPFRSRMGQPKRCRAEALLRRPARSKRHHAVRPGSRACSLGRHRHRFDSRPPGPARTWAYTEDGARARAGSNRAAVRLNPMARGRRGTCDRRWARTTNDAHIQALVCDRGTLRSVRVSFPYGGTAGRFGGRHRGLAGALQGVAGEIGLPTRLPLDRHPRRAGDTTLAGCSLSINPTASPDGGLEAAGNPTTASG